MSSRELILNQLKNTSPPDYYSKDMLSAAKSSTGSIDLFMQQASAAGAQVSRFSDTADAKDYLLSLIQSSSCRSLVSASDEVLYSLGIPKLIGNLKLEYHEAKHQTAEEYRGFIYEADMGISGCNYALADTGTVVILHEHNNERLISLAPNNYVCIVLAQQILADRSSLAAVLNQQNFSGLSTAITLITGVSRTADVALQVVLGMHGPRRVDIIIIG